MKQFRRAIAILALLLISGSKPVFSHALNGTETWVHIAEPGIELRMTFFSEKLARAVELNLSRNNGSSASMDEIWSVDSDGEPCNAEAGSIRSERSNGHLTIKLRYPCATMGEEVVLTPRFSSAFGRSRTNVLRVLVGDHLVEFQLRSGMRPVTIPVGKLIVDRNVVLSKEFLGGQD